MFSEIFVVFFQSLLFFSANTKDKVLVLTFTHLLFQQDPIMVLMMFVFLHTKQYQSSFAQSATMLNPYNNCVHLRISVHPFSASY